MTEATPDSRSRNADICDQATRYRVDAIYLGMGHYKAAERAQRLDRAIRIPTIALSAAVGSSLFATLSRDSSRGGRLVVAVVATAVAVLTAIHTFLRADAHAERHRAAGGRYGTLRREFDGFLLQAPDLPRDAALGHLADLRSEMSAVAKDAPLIPRRAYQVARALIREEAESDPTSVGVLVRAVSGTIVGG